MSDLIVVQGFEFSATTIRKDEMVNATSLTTAYRNKTGKRKDVRDWLVTKEAGESIAYLAGATGIPVSALVIIENGVGTWMHPDLAEIFAQWISVEYRFAVVGLIRQAKQEKLPQTFAEALLLAAKQQLAIEEAKKQSKLQQSQINILQEATERQAEVIDELFDYSSIIRIAKYNGCDEKAFSWYKLKVASQTLGIEIKKAPCPRYGEKNLYSHDAWRLAYPGYRLPETLTLTLSELFE